MPTVAQLLQHIVAQRAQKAPRLVGFLWDAAIARYRNRATGRLVSEKRILSMAEEYAEYSRSNIEALTRRFVEGELDLATWQERMARELKNAHIVAHLAGRGGRRAATQADWGQLGGRLRYEYERLTMFARDIKAGTLTQAQIEARAKTYAGAVRKSYFDGKTRAATAAPDLVEERRVLSPVENCEDCQRYADMGWQPIGTLPEPGEGSRCRGNCRCTKEYR